GSAKPRAGHACAGLQRSVNRETLLQKLAPRIGPDMGPHLSADDAVNRLMFYPTYRWTHAWQCSRYCSKTCKPRSRQALGAEASCSISIALLSAAAHTLRSGTTSHVFQASSRQMRSRC